MTPPTPAPVALVTGGAKRIGRAICLELAARGYRLAIHANRSLDEAERLARELETDAHAFGADLCDEDATRGMIDTASDHFGRLDVLVNNAAIWSPKPLEEVTGDDVLRFLRVNTVAPFVCAQHAGLIMCRQESGGAIVNLGDWADGDSGRPYPGYAAYHPSKGAIPAMTRALAIEFSARHARVRVNAVLPSPVLASPGETPQNMPQVLERNLLGVPARAEHVAAAVAFLAGHELITGACLPVDAGRTLHGSSA